MFRQVKTPKFKVLGRRCNRQKVGCGLQMFVLQATLGRCNKMAPFKSFVTQGNSGKLGADKA